MQEVFIETAKAFGANPQELAAIDIYQALQTGVIDGQDNPPANIWDFKMHEVSKYLTVTNYATGPDPFIVNLNWYNNRLGKSSRGNRAIANDRNGCIYNECSKQPT